MSIHRLFFNESLVLFNQRKFIIPRNSTEEKIQKYLDFSSTRLSPRGQVVKFKINKT